MIAPSIYHSLGRINIEPDHISFLSTHLHIQQMEASHNTIIPFTPTPSFCAIVVYIFILLEVQISTYKDATTALHSHFPFKIHFHASSHIWNFLFSIGYCAQYIVRRLDYVVFL